jgi:hypothetical protein
MKQKDIVIFVLISISLLLQSCGLSDAEVKATAQVEIYQAQTQQAEQAAVIAAQTVMAVEKEALAMTQTAIAMPPATSLPTEAPIPVSENTSCPVYVYQDWSADTKFVPEGFMGDISDINLDDNFLLDANRPNVIKISYMPKGDQNWAGVYWWVPGTNWGNGDDVGLNISCASKLTFWARGEKGDEKAEFKVGGIKGTYSDSLQPAFSSGTITLTPEWHQYTIDLNGKDLSYIMGGFVWVTKKPSNPNGATIYIDDIRFEQ